MPERNRNPFPPIFIIPKFRDKHRVGGRQLCSGLYGGFIVWQWNSARDWGQKRACKEAKPTGRRARRVGSVTCCATIASLCQRDDDATIRVRSKLCFILAYFSSPKTQVIWVIPRWKIGPSSQRGSPSLTDRGFNGPRDTYYSSTPLEDATA